MADCSAWHSTFLFCVFVFFEKVLIIAYSVLTIMMARFRERASPCVTCPHQSITAASKCARMASASASAGHHTVWQPIQKVTGVPACRVGNFRLPAVPVVRMAPRRSVHRLPGTRPAAVGTEGSAADCDSDVVTYWLPRPTIGKSIVALALPMRSPCPALTAGRPDSVARLQW
jgi:hypothetical protein